MNINDPFGRMGARREREYQSLCHALKEAGLKDPQAAQQQLDAIRKRGVYGVCIIVPLVAILMLLFPQALVFFIAIGAMSVMWLVNASRKGQLYLQRYIDEELSSRDDSQDI